MNQTTKLIRFSTLYCLEMIFLDYGLQTWSPISCRRIIIRWLWFEVSFMDSIIRFNYWTQLLALTIGVQLKSIRRTSMVEDFFRRKHTLLNDPKNNSAAMCDLLTSLTGYWGVAYIEDLYWGDIDEVLNRRLISGDQRELFEHRNEESFSSSYLDQVPFQAVKND